MFLVLSHCFFNQVSRLHDFKFAFVVHRFYPHGRHHFALSQGCAENLFNFRQQIYCAGISATPRRVFCAHLFHPRLLRFFRLLHVCLTFASPLPAALFLHLHDFFRVSPDAVARLFYRRAHAYYSRLVRILFGVVATFCLPFNQRTGRIFPSAI